MRALHLKYKKVNLEAAEEIDLIKRAVGNPEMFEPIYNKYFKQIYLYLFKRCADEMLAEDLTSQAFLKAMDKLHQYSDKGVPFSAWLYRIAHNELLLHFRHTKYTRAVHAKLQDVEILHDEIAEQELEKDRLATLKKALSSLSEDELSLVEMKYFEHRTYEEICDILDLTVSNAKVKMHRIMKKLNKLVQK